MRILGLHTGHDSSVAVVEDGKLVFAMEEERLTGRKKDTGIPARCLLYLDKVLGVNKFDKVALSSKDTFHYRTITTDTKLNVFPEAVHIDHHECHAISAYAMSGFNECKVLTLDGGGDSLFATIWDAKDGKITKLQENRHDEYYSFGLLYNRVTEKLGFIANRHEGKIMGLSSQGRPLEMFEDLFWVEGGKIRASGRMEEFIVDRRIESIGTVLIQDIAASCQYTFNRIVMEWIKANVKPYEKLAVAGGSFANVMTNREISEYVKDFYVCPPMADSGNSIGAAFSQFDKIPVKFQEHMYLGAKYVPRKHNKHSPKHVAKQIACGKVIGLAQGNMEFGPRALGNRSILADPRDRSMVDRINQRLLRTEFMPFAPVILEEFAGDILENYRKNDKNGPFMTCSWKVKEEWRDLIPAVVHIDNTARPQIIKQNTNPYYYQIVKEFYNLTGVPVLINTSFNAHEDPIICFDIEADFALNNNKIDMLVEA
jgi:carbamoyltransferase